MITLAGSDCEVASHDWLGEPVNTLSSLAFVVAGAYVLRAGGPRVFAVALGAVGAGSVIYHGSTSSGAAVEAAHNGSLMFLALAIVIAWSRGSLRPPPAIAVIAMGAAIGANLLTRTGAPLCRPDSVLQGHAAWHLLAALAAATWFGTKPIDQRTAESHKSDQPFTGREAAP